MSHTADDDTGSMSLPAGDGSASGSSGGDSNIAVILVEPKRGENIGAAARAMKVRMLHTIRCRAECACRMLTEERLWPCGG